jgi:hypothetical protein
MALVLRNAGAATQSCDELRLIGGCTMRVLIVCCVLFGIGNIAAADGMRCGQRLVNVGDTSGEVLFKCGAPTFADRRVETPASPDGSSRTITCDAWTYNLGPHDFVRVLNFVDGTLRSIELGGYGD